MQGRTEAADDPASRLFAGTGTASAPGGAAVPPPPGTAPGQPAARREVPASSRHQKRRLFGRSAKSDRHLASSVDPAGVAPEHADVSPPSSVDQAGVAPRDADVSPPSTDVASEHAEATQPETAARRQVTGFQVVKRLLIPRRSIEAAHAGGRAVLAFGFGGGRHAVARTAKGEVRLSGAQRRWVTGGLAVLIAGVAAAGSASAFQPGTSGPSATAARHSVVSGPVAPDWPQTNGVLNAVAPPTKAAFHLATAKSKPLPAPPSLASQPSLLPHEVFAFAPYWTLASQSAFDVSQMTTISYFGVDVNANGSIQESGDGWTGYESQDLANLISRAHAAGDRVVLTAECFNQTTLNELTSSPQAAAKLANELVSLVEAKSFDGINIDFEGQGSADQMGLDNLMAKVSSTVRAANPHWQITMDTYASSAGDPEGFYDIPGLASSVDAFFVMAYQMGAPAGAASPQNGGSNFSALEALKEYTAVVPASQVILGLPYYGYDWPTSGPGVDAVATGAATPVEDSQVFASKTQVNWSSRTSTAWTAYKSGSQWHQIWFEDASSLAIRAQLAQSYGVRGVGIWSLGMDGNDPALLTALVGSAGVLRNFTPPPSSNAGSPTTTTTRAPTTSTTKPATTSTTSKQTTTTTSRPTTTTTSRPTTTTTSTSSTTSTTQPSTTTTDPSTTSTTSAFSTPTT
jgi:spore germination protein YaaH